MPKADNRRLHPPSNRLPKAVGDSRLKLGAYQALTRRLRFSCARWNVNVAGLTW